MKPFAEPTQHLSPPPELESEDVEYIVVQISKRRYVVAEYAGCMRNALWPRKWNLVSGPLDYNAAIDLCDELLEKAKKHREANDKLKSR